MLSLLGKTIRYVLWLIFCCRVCTLSSKREIMFFIETVGGCKINLSVISLKKR